MHVKLLCILDERNYVECGNIGFLLRELIIVPCIGEQSWWIIENYFPDKCNTNMRNVRNIWLRLTLC